MSWVKTTPLLTITGSLQGMTVFKDDEEWHKVTTDPSNNTETLTSPFVGDCSVLVLTVDEDGKTTGCLQSKQTHPTSTDGTETIKFLPADLDTRQFVVQGNVGHLMVDQKAVIGYDRMGRGPSSIALTGDKAISVQGPDSQVTVTQ